VGNDFQFDPITGQAAWYDVRVRIYPAGRTNHSRHRLSLKYGEISGMKERPAWLAYFGGKKK